MKRLHVSLYDLDNGPKTVLFIGQSHCDVCGGSANNSIPVSRAASKRPNVSWVLCESRIMSCGRSSPQCFKKWFLSKHISHPSLLLERVKGVLKSGLDVVCLETFLGPIRIGGTSPPLALIQARYVILSLMFPTPPGLCIREIPDSSIFQMRSGC